VYKYSYLLTGTYLLTYKRRSFYSLGLGGSSDCEYERRDFRSQVLTQNQNIECCSVCNWPGRQGNGFSTFIFRCPVDARHAKILRPRVILVYCKLNFT